jgi:hypothetical protein
MKKGIIARILAGETLGKVRQSMVDIWKYFSPKNKSLDQYDYEALEKAYRQKQGIRPVINLSASFLFANWFEVSSEDEDAQEYLNDFWNRTRLSLLQGGIEGGLFGNTYLAFEYDSAADKNKMKILHPGSVKPVFDEQKPWVISGYAIKTKIGDTTIEELITTEKYTIRINGRDTDQGGDNPYGILPIVHVAEIRFSDEVYGTGEVDEALYDMAEKYKTVLDNGVAIEEYHGSPIPIFKGVKNFTELQQKLEDEKSWKPGMGIFLPNKDSDVKFLESTRSVENAVELLKKIFYNFVIQSETPEFMLGVHIPSSQASTKEQRAPVERKTERRRLVWTEGLQKANEILLRMREYHDGKKSTTYDSEISWGVIFEKDKAEEADILDKKSKAVATLRELEIMSTESARKALPEVIDDPAKEKERVDQEKAATKKLTEGGSV